MIAQLGIAFTGIIALFLTQSEDANRRRYACLFGIVGQPFWIWTSYSAEQWGILFLTFFYAAAWLKGLWTHWLQPYW